MKSLCDTCGKRFGNRSVIFEMSAICSCTVQPAAHGKLEINKGQNPHDICQHWEERKQ